MPIVSVKSTIAQVSCDRCGVRGNISISESGIYDIDRFGYDWIIIKENVFCGHNCYSVSRAMGKIK